MISFEAKGDFNHLDKFLLKMSVGSAFKALDRFGQAGVEALASTTPVDSGITAGSWGYTITQEQGGVTITWTNSHIVAGTPLVIMLQYGHGTGTGGYVQGRDFINPAIAPVFDRIADDVWKEVTSA